MENGVVHGPETVKSHNFLIPLDGGLHVAHTLVIHHVVDHLELGGRNDFIKGFLLWMRHETRQERACIIHTLDKGVDRVVEGLDGGRENGAVLILGLGHWGDRGGSLTHAKIIRLFAVFN